MNAVSCPIRRYRNASIDVLVRGHRDPGDDAADERNVHSAAAILQQAQSTVFA